VADKIHMSWNQYIIAVHKIAYYFKDERFDAIVGLTRGGLVPGVCLSHQLDTPMFAFDPHSLRPDGGERSSIGLPISSVVSRRLLIVDDIADTGVTFTKCSIFFKERGFRIQTAAVYSNKEVTKFDPTFFVHDNEKQWVVFPYEEIV